MTRTVCFLKRMHDVSYPHLTTPGQTVSIPQLIEVNYNFNEAVFPPSYFVHMCSPRVLRETLARRGSESLQQFWSPTIWTTLSIRVQPLRSKLRAFIYWADLSDPLKSTNILTGDCFSRVRVVHSIDSVGSVGTTSCLDSHYTKKRQVAQHISQAIVLFCHLCG